MLWERFKAASSRINKQHQEHFESLKGEVKEELKKVTDKDIQINIFEVKRPELDAVIVANNIARQVEGKIAYRRLLLPPYGAAPEAPANKKPPPRSGKAVAFPGKR